MKFKYNYFQNILWEIQNIPKGQIQNIVGDQIKREFSYSIDHPHSKFTTEYGAKGFILQPENHWITFKVYEEHNKIKVFYKKPQGDQIIYYQKWVPTIPLKQMPLCVPNLAWEVKFIITDQDEVYRNGDGKWVKKLAPAQENHANQG